MTQPSLLITIDTEGDNLWEKPQKILTKNANYIERFQKLCENYEIKPTYLTAYEMACSQKFQEFGRDIIDRNVGEIGMHLHAYNSPPYFSLTEDDYKFQPYLIEYPENIIEAKIDFLTKKLKNIFNIEIRSHRAGRWAFNEIYAQKLEERGYLVDCSVTPNVSWKSVLGDPKQGGGVEYIDFPESQYFINLNNIRLSGDSKLLEVPMTIFKRKSKLKFLIDNSRKLSDYFFMAINRIYPYLSWLRPNGKNLSSMIEIITVAAENNKDYVQFMLHSSELMPGGSPTFPTKKHIEKLYKDLNILFSMAGESFNGATLSEFYNYI